MFESRRVSAAIAAAGFSVLAAAQVPPQLPRLPDAGSILEQQRPKEPLPIRPSEEPVLPQVTPAPKPALPATTKVSVTVKEFRFSGNTRFPAEQLQELVREFVGKTLDFNGLNDAAGRVQRFYRERGYFLAVAYLPQQEIRDGVVEIAVLEGRLGSVILQRDAQMKLRESFARSILNAHLKPGDLITENALERPLLLLRDLPDIELSSELGPSKTQVGAADLTVKLSEQRRWVSGYFDVDNHGNRFTGEYRLGVNLNSSNFTGYGDLFSFRGFLSDGDMQFGRLSYVIPVGPYGTRIGASYTAFAYELGEEFEALEANGEGQVLTIYGLHPLLRTRNANLFLQAGFEGKKLEDRIDSVGTSEERDITAGKIGVVGDFRDRLFSGGLNSYAVTYTRGDLELEPEALRAIDASPGIGPNTAGSFSKWNLDLRRLQRITDQFNLLLGYSGQLASKNLTAAERMSLGGPNGVRAFPVGEAPGDTGHLFTAELRYIFPQFQLFGGDLTASTFYDYGRVDIFEDPPPVIAATEMNTRSISGYGVGLSLGREGNFLVRVNVATPASGEPPTSDTKERDPRVWVQAVKWF
jgi:hemolysin activation/secretion protein